MGVVAQRLERKTHIHEVVGSNPAVVTSSVLPKGWGLDDSASGIGQAKSRFQLKSELHLGKFHRADLVLEMCRPRAIVHHPPRNGMMTLRHQYRNFLL